MRQICSYSQPGMEKVTASVYSITIVRQEMRLQNKDNLVSNSFEKKKLQYFEEADLLRAVEKDSRNKYYFSLNECEYGAHLRSFRLGCGRGGTRQQKTCSQAVRFVHFRPGEKKLGRCPEELCRIKIPLVAWEGRELQPGSQKM